MSAPETLLFAGVYHYPYGGWDDLHIFGGTIEEIKAFMNRHNQYDWAHIVDVKSMRKVCNGVFVRKNYFDPEGSWEWEDIEDKNEMD